MCAYHFKWYEWSDMFLEIDLGFLKLAIML